MQLFMFINKKIRISYIFVYYCVPLHKIWIKVRGKYSRLGSKSFKRVTKIVGKWTVKKNGRENMKSTIKTICFWFFLNYRTYQCIELGDILRNFLDTLKLFLNAKCPYPYEVKCKLVKEKGSLTPICSL